MIYPAIRISDLERDVAQKKSQLGQTFETFQDSLKDNLKPTKLLKKNKKAVLLGVLSLFLGGKALGKVNKFIVPKIMKSGWVLSMFEAAWFWNILSSGFNNLIAPRLLRSIERLIGGAD